VETNGDNKKAIATFLCPALSMAPDFQKSQQAGWQELIGIFFFSERVGV
jgi:hypothetical protein